MTNSIYAEIKKRIEIAESKKMSWETGGRKEYPQDFRWSI